jgi:hypothetical protein
MHLRLSIPLAGRRFSAPPLLRRNTAPDRLRAGRADQAWAFMFVTDHFSLAS